MPRAGIEPAWDFSRGILSPLRLPFRHPGNPCILAIPPVFHTTESRFGNEFFVEKLGDPKVRDFRDSQFEQFLSWRRTRGPDGQKRHLYGACADNPMLYTYVVLLAETGSRSRSEALGHSSITTTMMYTHLVRENLLDLPGVQPVLFFLPGGPLYRNVPARESRE